MNHIGMMKEVPFAAEENPVAKPFPCIMMFDSLRMHHRATIVENIRTWLNYEWGRRNMDGNMLEPYTERTMIVTVPEVPLQLNGFDCGVYLCRYTYGLLKMWQSAFTYEEGGVEVITSHMHMQQLWFSSFLRDKGQFEFGQEDIDRMRQELKTLVLNLAQQGGKCEH